MRLPLEGICQPVSFAQVLRGECVQVNESWQRRKRSIVLCDVKTGGLLEDPSREVQAMNLVHQVLSDLDRLWLVVPQASAFLYLAGADMIPGELFISTERTISDVLVAAGLGVWDR